MDLPTQFGKYHIIEKIAVGGMAEVFLAKAFGVEGFERLLVVKKILPHMAEDEEFITMFIDEARISSSLNHSNIVQINELGKEGNDFFIAMEFVHGKDLGKVFERVEALGRTIPIPVAILIATRVCEGLEYAHRKTDSAGTNLKIIHRDVSPGNVLISYDGDVKLIDFGIAKARNRSGRTTAGTLKGKLGYMSPEQVRGHPLDHRSDIFGLGILLHEMLSGKKLFGANGDIGALEKVRSAVIVPPSTNNSKIPKDLDRVVMRALAREPSERYEWASDLQEDLVRFLMRDGVPVTSKTLAAFIRELFADMLLQEHSRLAVYRRRGYPLAEGSLPEPELRPSPILKPELSSNDQPTSPRTPLGFSAPAVDTTRMKNERASGAVENTERTESAADTSVVKTPVPLPEPAGDTAVVKTPVPFPERSPEASPEPTPEPSLDDPFDVGNEFEIAPEPKVEDSSEETTVVVTDRDLARMAAAESLKHNTGGAGGAHLRHSKRVLVQSASSSAGRRSAPRSNEVSPETAPKNEALTIAIAAAVGLAIVLTVGFLLFSPSDDQARPNEEESFSPPQPVNPLPSKQKDARTPPQNRSVPDEKPVVPESPVTARPAAVPTPVPMPVPVPVPTPATDPKVPEKTATPAANPRSAANEINKSTQRVRSQNKRTVTKDVAHTIVGAGTGYLIANTKPWARVIVDGRDTGLWTPIPPAKQIPLTAGVHQVTFKTQDGRSMSISIKIEAGETLKLINEIR